MYNKNMIRLTTLMCILLAAGQISECTAASSEDPDSLTAKSETFSEDDPESLSEETEFSSEDDPESLFEETEFSSEDENLDSFPMETEISPEDENLDSLPMETLISSEDDDLDSFPMETEVSSENDDSDSFPMEISPEDDDLDSFPMETEVSSDNSDSLSSKAEVSTDTLDSIASETEAFVSEAVIAALFPDLDSSSSSASSSDGSPFYFLTGDTTDQTETEEQTETETQETEAVPSPAPGLTTREHSAVLSWMRELFGDQFSFAWYVNDEMIRRAADQTDGAETDQTDETEADHSALSETSPSENDYGSSSDDSSASVNNDDSGSSHEDSSESVNSDDSGSSDEDSSESFNGDASGSSCDDSPDSADGDASGSSPDDSSESSANGEAVYYRDLPSLYRLENVQYPKVEKDMSFLERTLNKMISSYDGIWSIGILDLSSNEQIIINDRSMKSASVMKLFIMAAVYNAIDKGELERTSELVSRLNSMISSSSNEDANQLLCLLGDSDPRIGIAKVNEYIVAEGFSSKTREYNGFNDDSYVFHRYLSNKICAADVLDLLSRVYHRTLGSWSVCNEIENMMLNQQTRYKIPAGVADISSDVKIGNKTGEMDYVENDAAVVYSPACDYIICVFSEGWDSKDDAQEEIQAISAEVYRYFNDSSWLTDTLNIPRSSWEDS